MPKILNRDELPFASATAAHVGPARINIAYQRLGDPDAPAVLLIMGLMGQCIHWPDLFCQTLVRHGLQVVRFDNRDAGLSTHITQAPPANLPAALAGDLSSVAYTLSDMAADAVGLLDALAIRRAHVVGASMGGAIAQWMAIEHPPRVASLTVMMSSTGNRTVGQPDPALLRDLFSRPAPQTRAEVIEQVLRVRRAIGSPKYPPDEADSAALAARAFDRSHDPAANARQAVAQVASGDWTARLRSLSVPTLVIHGLADRMANVSGGRAVAEAIPGAELWLLDGMGHDLPRRLQPQLAARIAAFISSARVAPAP